MENLDRVEIAAQVYLEEGTDPFGGVRKMSNQGRPEITIYIENAGEFVVPADAIRSAHDGKVILDRNHLDERLLEAIAHAHDREVPGL
ncbi:MAG TPA: hypothetical protein VIB79_30750 [Candidatus Binatia bacterium]|jgi:hypothetical protein